MSAAENKMYALTYANQGWPVFPVPPGTKKSHKSAKFSDGRRWGATTDPEEIERDFANWPDANVGIVTGSEPGIFVVETDTLAGHNVDGEASLKELEAKHGQLPETLKAQSPSGSAHYYFKHPGGGIKIKNSSSELGPGIDVRGDGGMVLAPPSVKPGVGEYEWLNENLVADAPNWLIELVAERADRVRPSLNADPEADIIRVVAALAVIPNNDLGWDEWNRIGMATWRATAGSEDGLAAFDRWSHKSMKYDCEITRERWEAYFASPPTEIGARSLFYLATETMPNWSKVVDEVGKHAPEIFRLAAMPRAEYERARKEVADRLAMRVGVVDDIVALCRPQTPAEAKALQGQALELPEIVPWTEPVDGAKLLTDMTAAIRRHVVLSEQQALAVALWTIHAHLLDCAAHSPRLHISSPAPRCGKTVLLRTIAPMVPRALSAENVSTAVLFRVIEKLKPTLLIDEVDAFLKGEHCDELRGMLNAGHAPGGRVIRIVGEDHEPRAFNVWAAVVLAGIGNIPGTIEDRSITIHMRRRLRDEKTDRLGKEAIAQLGMLGRRAARWADDNRLALSDADPSMPEALNDRAADNWRPLIAIADRMNVEVGAKARAAAVALVSEELVEESNSILALADVAATFQKRAMEWMPSAELVKVLLGMEDRPWQAWNRGRPLTQVSLARLLRPYGVVTRNKRPTSGEAPIRGYERGPVEEAANRYVGRAVVPDSPQDKDVM